MIFRRLFGKNPHAKGIELLYGKIMAHIRNPVFYTMRKVPDTLDGRFDLLALHVFLVVRRIKDEAGGGEMARLLPEKMLGEIDRALREHGISDMGVPRRVKTMGRAFLGRATAYENALNAADREKLEDVLRRNLFSDAEVGQSVIGGFAGYVLAAEAHLNGLAYDDISSGKVSFPEIGGV